MDNLCPVCKKNPADDINDGKYGHCQGCRHICARCRTRPATGERLCSDCNREIEDWAAEVT